MHFPYFVAKRYLFSKKSHNAINIISVISVIGVMVGTTALIVILSIFNGLDGLVKSLMNSFDPDIRITAVEGKVFVPDSLKFAEIRKLPGVIDFAQVVEETALLEYADKQAVVTAKGVSNDYYKMSGIDTMIVQGKFKLAHQGQYFAVLGYGIAYNLSIGLENTDPLKIYYPNKSYSINQNPENAFNSKLIYPSGFFSIQNEYDTKYILLPIALARELLNYEKEVTSVEIKLKIGVSDRKIDAIQKNMAKILGSTLKIENQRQQHELINKTMNSEKWAIFFILSFVLLIASFNVVGSLTMLIIDKKNDIITMQALGANQHHIHQIFFTEGWLISILGAVLGLIFGTIICWCQMQFGWVSFPNSSIISAYPVQMVAADFIMVFFTVVFIGFFAAWFPVRYITRKYIHI